MRSVWPACQNSKSAPPVALRVAMAAWKQEAKNERRREKRRKKEKKRRGKEEERKEAGRTERKKKKETKKEGRKEREKERKKEGKKEGRKKEGQNERKKQKKKERKKERKEAKNERKKEKKQRTTGQDGDHGAQATSKARQWPRAQSRAAPTGIHAPCSHAVAQPRAMAATAARRGTGHSCRQPLLPLPTSRQRPAPSTRKARHTHGDDESGRRRPRRPGGPWRGTVAA